MLALILADGDAPTRADLDRAWPRWADGLGLVVAADGGARHAAGLGVEVDLWVGDGDSLDPAALDALADAGVPIERARPDKDESDTELAVRAALARGVDGIVIVGALGGQRVDHALANVALLAVADRAGIPAVIHAGMSRISLLRAPTSSGAAASVELAGARGDLVSLLPHGADVVGVTTTGLRYPLRDEPLAIGSSRGLSNVVEAAPARVDVRDGRLLLVESPATIER